MHPEKIFSPVPKETLPTILDLIKHISIYPATWGIWLPGIDKKKEEILLHKFEDQGTRNSLFNILSEDDDKINALGKLALVKNLKALVEAGEKKLQEQYRKEQHTEYIKMIGELIQNMIQKQIDVSLEPTFASNNPNEDAGTLQDNKLQQKEQQNGQDFIIYRGDIPIYYIEVKSRWDIGGIVALSKRQVERCAENPGKYAVISVDVAGYKSRYHLEIDEVSFDLLKNDIYVNDDLSEEFDALIEKNRELEFTLEGGKLIEFRGHIPQDRVKKHGFSFEVFIEKLKKQLMFAVRPEVGN